MLRFVILQSWLLVFCLFSTTLAKPESLEERLPEASHDEDGNPMLLSQEEDEGIFLYTVQTSSYSRYVYGIRKNKTSSYHCDAWTFTATTSGTDESSFRKLEDTTIQLASQLQDKDKRIQMSETTVR
ncbi:uncharacterized protein LOC107260981 [Ricinus communis]|uniref:uncharacterized protein LOC107260981 n=1 Tax=Ricinus communis TaxID=3988 RepID=UPI00201AB0C5|nr:uncharacterized protein LOC107260981 [Ricinus communis]